jgi:hypothetical protein
MGSKKLHFILSAEEQITNQQIPPFPCDGLVFFTIEGSSLFSYQLRCNDTDTYYSDKPIISKGEKVLLPVGSHQGRTFSFDFENRSNEQNRVDLQVKFEPATVAPQTHSFREYTLDGLGMRSPVEIEPDRGIEVSLTNFRGRHFQVHEMYSLLDKGLFCRIKHHDRIVRDFYLEAGYRFDKPWTLKWTDSVILCFANRGSSKVKIEPTKIYFAGYLKPTRIINKIAPINLRNSFLIEGIRLP